MAEKTLNTIIVLRNDHEGPKFGTQDSNVTLRAGELGVHYMDNGKVMVKMGDGVSAWKDLKQVEQVFEENQYITRSFGKYTTSDSKPVNAGGAGMTTSEWIMSCLAEVIDPTITQPNYSLAASTITTNTGTTEVGSKVTTLAWNGTFGSGSYSYGSRSDTNNDGKVDDTDTWDKTTGTGVTATYVMTSTNAGTFSGQTLDGTLTLTNPITITDAASTSCGSITGTCTWTASTKHPVNNLGVLSGDPIAAKTTADQTVNYSVSGYRKMFMSAVQKHPTNNIDSAFIRGLTTINKKAATGNQDFTAVAGDCGFYVAIPEAFTTKAPTFKTEFNKEYIDFTGVEVYMGVDPTTNVDLWEDISKATTYGTVNVEGANSYTAKPYRVYRYIPGTATGKFTANETKYRVIVAQ